MKTTQTTRRRISNPFANHVIAKRRDPTDDITEADIEWIACAATSRVLMYAVSSGFDRDDLCSRALEGAAYAISKWDRARCPEHYKKSQWILAMTIRHCKKCIKLHIMKLQRRRNRTLTFSEASNSIELNNSMLSKKGDAGFAERYNAGCVVTSSRDRTPVFDVVDEDEYVELKDKQFVLDNLRKLGVKEDRTRQWIYTHYYLGVPCTELAKQHNCSAANVSAIMRKAMKKINKQLALEVLA